MKTYTPASTTYQRLVREATRDAILAWSRDLDRASMHFFKVDGVECALEFFTGHWGFEEVGRWRWGRADAGDPDEDTSGEDVLMEVALGRALPLQPPAVRRRWTWSRSWVGPTSPAPRSGRWSPNTPFIRAEIRALVTEHTRENLNRLVLRSEPRA